MPRHFFSFFFFLINRHICTWLISAKSGDELETGESDSDPAKYEDRSKTLANIQRKRRHDKSTCLLCSAKADTLVSETLAARSRKTSTSSVHRIRTGKWVSAGWVAVCFLCKIVIILFYFIFPSLMQKRKAATEEA